MGKIFAVVLVVIALASAYPIVTHMYVPPEDISTHGHQIDEQLSDTMAEAGISFLLAQFVLAFFVWKFAERKDGAKLTNFPGGATVMVAAAFIHLAKAGCPADPGTGGPICLLLPVSRRRWKIRRHPSRQN